LCFILCFGHQPPTQLDTFHFSNSILTSWKLPFTFCKAKSDGDRFWFLSLHDLDGCVKFVRQMEGDAITKFVLNPTWTSKQQQRHFQSVCLFFHVAFGVGYGVHAAGWYLSLFVIVIIHYLYIWMLLTESLSAYADADIDF
jgi:hypothetical protein